ncbi:MAG TPA: dihydrodipicolinate synthase family protein [Pyrinomonadaceae bacterium]|nr:dihydrodipicolinate synthase family protein [Pyrinomonadaceae bacterium]
MKQPDGNITPDIPLDAKLRERLRGILLPFPTPFGADGEVDVCALRDNIARWNRTGVSGYVALGSTGERVHLDERERAAVVEAARAAVPEGLAFVVGVGEHGTRATVNEARRAARAGADALLVITPHFYRGVMGGEALRAHFEAVADASPAPVILYNIPQNTGVALAPEVAARLSEHENVVGLKDSSGDVVNLMETIRLVGAARADFVVTTGHAAVLYPALAAGAGGAILAAACAVPRLCVEIFEAVAAGDHERARRMQARLAPVARAVTVGYGIGGLKAALDLLGYHGGPVREPLRPPDERARREIAELLKAVDSSQ